MVEAVLEVGALAAPEWTGTAKLVAGLAGAALRDDRIAWSFMLDTLELPRPLVEQMLARRSGAVAGAAIATLAWEQGEFPRARAGAAAGVFVQTKPVRRFFAREALVLSDLGPLLSPDLHDRAAAAAFADHIDGDIASSDHLFCTARATRDDLRAYFTVPEERLSLIEPGVAFDPADLSAARLAAHGLACEPYVAILGTRDPRRAGEGAIAHLARDPAFAARYRMVCIGRVDRPDETVRLLARLDEAGIARDRLIFTGFLAERERTALILNAAFCIQPGWSAGAGLAVREAAALGRLTVCPDLSALPEAAPAASLFFDPADPASLAAAIARAEDRIAATPPTPSLADLIAAAAPHAPARGYAPIARWVLGA